MASPGAEDEGGVGVEAEAEVVRAAELEDGARAAAGADGAADVCAVDGAVGISAAGLAALAAGVGVAAFLASSFAGAETLSLREDCSPRRRAKRLAPKATKRMMLIASGPARRVRGARSGRKGP